MDSETFNPAQRKELRRFLMARRASIQPEAVGLPPRLRRRTPGLRREEVAALAGIGVSWYTWFEQGREIRVSAQLLERVAETLRLSPSDIDYLFALAGVARNESAAAVERSYREVQQVVDSFQAGPALFLSARGDVLAYNALADLVFEFDAYDGPFAQNHFWRLFMDPRRKAKYLDWQAVIEPAVGWLRTMSGKLLEDEELKKLVSALCDGSEEFRVLWNAQVTKSLLAVLPVGMKLPQQQTGHFSSMRFRAMDSFDFLTLLTPADERTAAALQVLRTKR